MLSEKKARAPHVLFLIWGFCPYLVNLRDQKCEKLKATGLIPTLER